MSGGSFGYVYHKVEEFVKDLEDAIDSEELKLKGETKVELRDVIKQANYVAGLMKAVEWMYSCDISEDGFMEYVHALQKDFVKATGE